jgi:hypothetical protein
MTQDTVDQILGRLLTDPRFRAHFFRRRHFQLEQFDLVEHEIDSLAKLDRDAVELLVELLANQLDPRIRRG